jgi:hypothetical protein
MDIHIIRLFVESVCNLNGVILIIMIILFTVLLEWVDMDLELITS